MSFLFPPSNPHTHLSLFQNNGLFFTIHYCLHICIYLDICMCICVCLCTWKCTYVCLYVYKTCQFLWCRLCLYFQGDHWYSITSWWALPWRRLFLLLSAFFSWIWLFVWAQDCESSSFHMSMSTGVVPVRSCLGSLLLVYHRQSSPDIFRRDNSTVDLLILCISKNFHSFSVMFSEP